MDAARYARVRELFLAAEELSPSEQDAFLKIQTEGDPDLLTEVQSLLAEHDAESAKLEGEQAMPVPAPPASAIASSDPSLRRSLQTVYSGDTTQRGGTAGPTKPGKAKPNPAQITRHGADRTHASRVMAKRHRQRKPHRPCCGKSGLARAGAERPDGCGWQHYCRRH